MFSNDSEIKIWTARTNGDLSFSSMAVLQKHRLNPYEWSEWLHVQICTFLHSKKASRSSVSLGRNR